LSSLNLTKTAPFVFVSAHKREFGRACGKVATNVAASQKRSTHGGWPGTNGALTGLHPRVKATAREKGDAYGGLADGGWSNGGIFGLVHPSTRPAGVGSRRGAARLPDRAQRSHPGPAARHGAPGLGRARGRRPAGRRLAGGVRLVLALRAGAVDQCRPARAGPGAGPDGGGGDLDAGGTGILVETADFQAPDFYRRVGFSVFGEVPDLPPGSRTYFLLRRLNDGT